MVSLVQPVEQANPELQNLESRPAGRGTGATEISNPRIVDLPAPGAVDNLAALMRRQETIAGALRTFLAALEPFGVDTLAAGDVDLSDKSKNVFYALHWPEPWTKYYRTQRLQERDPIVEALDTYDEPFTWTDLRNDKRFVGLTQDELDNAGKYGWRDGLIVPIPRSGVQYGLVSLVSRTPRVLHEAKGLLSLGALAFYHQVRALAPHEGFPVPPLGLTDRERQCLALIASGLSDRKIAAKLDITENTARSYFETARLKLKADTRPQAVAEAIRWGIIPG